MSHSSHYAPDYTEFEHNASPWTAITAVQTKHVTPFDVINIKP